MIHLLNLLKGESHLRSRLAGLRVYPFTTIFYVDIFYVIFSFERSSTLLINNQLEVNLLNGFVLMYFENSVTLKYCNP